jgi:iron complex transport system substrate-binding protein
VSYDVVQQAVHRLQGQRTILSLEPTSLDGILHAIQQVGDAADVSNVSGRLVRTLQQRIDRIAAAAKGAGGQPRVFGMEWLDPPFTAGHWVPEMVRLAAGHDELALAGAPSSQVVWSRTADYDPEIVVLMPCGFTLERTVEEFAHVDFPVEWRRLSAVREGRVYAVNGSAYFNRPGPRIVEGLEILAEIIHPEVFPRTSPPEAWRRLG